jgi:hypothetical protein
LDCKNRVSSNAWMTRDIDMAKLIRSRFSSFSWFCTQFLIDSDISKSTPCIRMSVHTWITPVGEMNQKQQKGKLKQPLDLTMRSTWSVTSAVLNIILPCFVLESASPGKSTWLCAAQCDLQFIKQIVYITEWLKGFLSTRRQKLLNAFVPMEAPGCDARQYTHSHSPPLEIPAFQWLPIKTPRPGPPIIFHTGWAFNIRTIRPCLSKPVENHFN